MEWVSKNDIISNFISQEMKHVYEKYQSKNEEELSAIVDFINNLGGNLRNFNPYDDYNITKELAVLFKEEGNIDTLRIYQILNDDYYIDITIGKIKEIISNLENEGIVDDDGFYIYYENMEKSMVDLAEQDLLEKMEDAYEVTRIFDPEDVAEMWINRKGVEEVVDDLLSANSWNELLECKEPEEILTDSNGRVVMVAIKEQ